MNDLGFVGKILTEYNLLLLDDDLLVRNASFLLSPLNAKTCLTERISQMIVIVNKKEQGEIY
jgi:hypothetical protein